jgi:hypothetical protein
MSYLPIPYYLLPIPYYLFPITYSLLPIPSYRQFIAAESRNY